jgi:hypothetical protein
LASGEGGDFGSPPNSASASQENYHRGLWRDLLIRTTIMPVTLSKVHKQISKKRGVVNALHENSRDAQRLRKAGARDDRLSRHSATVLRARQPYSETYLHVIYGPLN